MSIEGVKEAGREIVIRSPVTRRCVAADNDQVVSFVIDKAVNEFLLISTCIDWPVVCTALIVSTIGW